MTLPKFWDCVDLRKFVFGSRQKVFANPCAKHIIGVGDLGFDSRLIKSDIASLTTRHRCDVSLEVSCPGAKSRRCAPLLVTRFGVIP